MGQQNVTEQLKSQAVGQIYDRMFQEKQFQAGQNAAQAAAEVDTYKANTDRMAKEGKLTLDEYKMRLEGYKTQLEALKAQSQISKDTALTNKYQTEIDKNVKFLDTITQVQETGETDIRNLDVGTLAALGLKPADFTAAGQEDAKLKAANKKFKSTQNKELRSYILSLEGVSAFSGLKSSDKERVADQTVFAEQLMAGDPNITIAQASQIAQRTMKLQYRLKELQKDNENIVYGEDEDTGVRGFYDQTTGELIEGI